MWSKLSSALKPARPGTPALEDDESPVHTTNVISKVYEQHPNLSVFHTNDEVPFPSPSPPASPSRHGRMGVFKRLPKAPEFVASSPKLLPLAIPKKVKSNIHIHNGSDLSLGRPSTDSPQELANDMPRPSQESTRPPFTPTSEGRFGSLRSILRDRNTPATGQSVRFFSRDAYKVISPDTSAASNEPDPTSFTARLHNSKPRPSAQHVFSAPDTPSLMAPIPPPDISNIFDISQEAELPTIPISSETPSLLDSAIEIEESQVDHTERPSTPVTRSPLHDRSQSFSFGQTVFHSVSQENSSDQVKVKSNRSRALSDTVFESLLHVRPEADINDESTALMIYSSPEREKDPFGTHATAYYTPGGNVPPTPPQSIGHARQTSREEDLILSLSTQVSLHKELCAQYEADLGARDALVEALNARLAETEKDNEKRRQAARTWRKRVGELEKCVTELREEVERSREESMDRSVMDEATSEALRMLHRKIEDLEREKAETDKREAQAGQEITAREEELRRVRAELEKRDESERELKAGIKAARQEMEEIASPTDGGFVAKNETLDEDERARLVSANEALLQEQASLQSQLTDAREEIVHKEEEMRVLRAELEAQWKHTEESGEKIRALEQERDDYKADVEALNERIEGMEQDWLEAENRRTEIEAELQEVWAAKEEAIREKHQADEQLRSEQEHADQITQALQEREDRVSALEQEKQYARENIARLEAHVREREAEASDALKRASECEIAAEEAQEEMARMKREHARISNEQSRKLQDVVGREVEARVGMEAMVREKAEAVLQSETFKERSTALKDEVERLRRQVHELQQESADKEVKLAHMAKQRAQDKDDLNGLNIALDSKQQELELLKRRIGVRNSTSATPAQKVPHRRESSIFGTPAVTSTRPGSAMSDASSTAKDRRTETPSTVTKPALGRSVRGNGPTSTLAGKRSLEGTMGPPPASRASVISPTTATPSRIPSTGARNPPSAMKTPIQRRGSTSATESSRLRSSLTSRASANSLDTLSEPDEKENTVPSSKATRRMSAVPA